MPQLKSKIVQIQTIFHPGDHNCGEHVQTHALCEDGTVWIKYFSSGKSNVPSDGAWHPEAGYRKAAASCPIHGIKPDMEFYISPCENCKLLREALDELGGSGYFEE